MRCHKLSERIESDMSRTPLSEAILYLILFRLYRLLILQPALSNIIADKFADILRTMGRYQSIAITKQAAVAMNNVKDTVVGAVTEVSNEAKQIQNKVESLPLSLPPKA